MARELRERPDEDLRAPRRDEVVDLLRALLEPLERAFDPRRDLLLVAIILSLELVLSLKKRQ